MASCLQADVRIIRNLKGFRDHSRHHLHAKSTVFITVVPDEELSLAPIFSPGWPICNQVPCMLINSFRSAESDPVDLYPMHNAP